MLLYFERCHQMRHEKSTNVVKSLNFRPYLT